MDNQHIRQGPNIAKGPALSYMDVNLYVILNVKQLEKIEDGPPVDGITRAGGQPKQKKGDP